MKGAVRGLDEAAVKFGLSSRHHLLTMEGHVQQKTTPLARELTRAFNNYNRQTVLLKKNLKETNAFFREMRQNYSNTCASSTLGSDSASLETGEFEYEHPFSAPKCV